MYLDNIPRRIQKLPTDHVNQPRHHICAPTLPTPAALFTVQNHQ